MPASLSRPRRVYRKVRERGLDALLVTAPHNVKYLSRYTGTNGVVLVARNAAYFLTDFRYAEQARKQVKDCRVIVAERSLLADLARIRVLRKGIKLGFEKNNVTVGQHGVLKKNLRGVKLVATEGVVEFVSVTKEPVEISRIARAASIIDEAFEHILDFIKPGVRELDLALEIEHFVKRNGAPKGMSFDTIVASGVRSAMPHGVASEKKIRKGEFITFDMGVWHKEYASDLTRTVVVGKASTKQRKIYQIVLEAQRAAVSAIRPGAKCREVDAVARDMISVAGYGDCFGHGLGHGLGLVVHDQPALNPRSPWVLEPGMVVTVEPGIYIPRWGGVRIEDDVAVTKAGHRVLTRSPKELIEI